MADKGRITIVGLGALGGSYALALRGRGYHISAIDRDEATIAYALEKGMAAEGVCTGQVDSSLSARNAHGVTKLLGAADCVILGLYPDRILSWLRVYRSLLKPGALICDMAQVKGSFLDEAQTLMPQGCEFIACHPVISIPGSGIRAADARYLSGANFLVVSTPQNTARGVAFAQTLGQMLGCGAVTVFSAAEHDSLVGYASQLPHALALCLMVGSGDHRIPSVAANSYQYLARIANINAELWSEVFLANTPVLTRQIGAYIDNLTDLRRRLANGDREGLRQLLEQGARHSRAFLSGGGAAGR